MSKSATAEAVKPPLVVLLDPKEIRPSPFQTRVLFKGIEELAEDLKRRGLLQPVMVRQVEEEKGSRYELVFGERRWRAAKVAKLEGGIPARVVQMDDATARETVVIENGQREDLTELEEARGYQLLKEAGVALEEIATKTGKSVRTIQTRLQLLQLGEAAKGALEAGEISASIALLLARIPEVDLQAQALKDITKPPYEREPYSYRQALDHIYRNYMLELDKAPFDTKSADLVPAAGACTTCPFRTGNAPDLFPDIKRKDTCTKPGCFKDKVAAESALKRAAAEAAGAKVLEGKKADEALSYGSDYVKLDQPNYDDAKSRTYAQLARAAKADVEKVVVIDKGGAAVEMVTKAAAKKIAEAAGVKTPSYRSGGGGGDASYKKRRQQHDVRKKVVAAALEKVVALHDGNSADKAFWLLLLEGILECVYGTTSLVAKRRGWIPTMNGDGAAAIRRHVKDLKVHELEVLALEILISGGADGGNWGSGYGKAFRAVCAEYDVDLKLLEKEHTPAPKAKKKPAKKAKPKGKAKAA